MAPHATRHAHSIVPLAVPATTPAGAEVLVLFGGFSKHGFSSSWLSLLHLGTATGPGAATTPDISYAERTTAMSRSLGAEAGAPPLSDQGEPWPAASAADAANGAP